MVIIIITFLILYFLLNHNYINMYVYVKFYFNRYIYCSLLLNQVLTCPILAQKASSSQGLQLSSANLVADILTPVQVLHTPHVNIDSSASDESSDDEPTSTVTSVCNMSAPRPSLPLPQRPQVGMKTPKSSFPPKRCINVICKEEKQALKEETALLKAEIDDCK